MFTVKFMDDRGSESIYGDVRSTSWHRGVLTARLSEGGSVQFGPNFYRPDTSPAYRSPVAFVMNENGTTVGKYDFYMMTEEDTAAYMRAAETAISSARSPTSVPEPVSA